MIQRRCHRAVTYSTFLPNRYMSSLSFPDISVWLALLIEDHIHRPAAVAWWRVGRSGQIAFSRLTPTGVLRLLNTSAAMNGQRLSMAEAWSAYDYHRAGPGAWDSAADSSPNLDSA